MVVLKINCRGNYALYWQFLDSAPETIRSLCLRKGEKKGGFFCFFLRRKNLRGLDPDYFLSILPPISKTSILFYFLQKIPSIVIFYDLGILLYQLGKPSSFFPQQSDLISDIHSVAAAGLSEISWSFSSGSHLGLLSQLSFCVQASINTQVDHTF